MFFNRNLLLAGSFLLLFQSVSAKDSPEAIQGVLDLRDYNFFEDGILNVKGEWIFYWNEVIDPVTYSNAGGTIIPVPSSWGSLEALVPGIESKGYASYQLTILMPDNVQRLAFRFTGVYSGSGYYINGKIIGFNGFPGTNRYQSVFSSMPSLHTSSISDSVVNLVIHVSNFDHRIGGIRGGMELGFPMQIMGERADRQSFDFFLIGAFLFAGFFFLGMFLIHTDFDKLFFSLICLIMAIRIIFLSEGGILNLDWMNGIEYTRINYLTFSLLVPLFVIMIRFVFPNDFPKLFIRIIVWVCLFMIIIVIITPVSFFTGALLYYAIFFLFISVTVILVLIRAWVRGRAYALGFAIGILIVVAGALNDVLYYFDIISSAKVSHLTMFAYLLVYAIIFSLKSNHLVRQSEKLAEEISVVNDNLESIVEDRTAELKLKSSELERHQHQLEESNKGLQQMNSIRSMFITVIGHDIRGPVGYTSQMLELLLTEKMSKKEEKEILTLLMNSSKATMNLLENLLVWGRSKIGNLAANSELFKVHSIVNETADLFTFAVKEKKIDLKINVDAKLKVYSDKEQFKIVLRNLLSNAIKFTGVKGKVEILATLSEQGDETIFEVSDTGVGIPSILINSIFKSDELRSTEGTNKEKGSGIGLKICKEVLELNNGWIKLKSKTGEGSVFTFGLPVSISR